MGPKCYVYRDHFISPLMKLMKFHGSTVAPLRKIILRELGVIIQHLGYHAKFYLPQIMNMINTYWDHVELRKYEVLLLEKLSLALNDEFQPELEIFLPKLLASIQDDLEIQVILHSLVIFGATVDPFLKVIIPLIVMKYYQDTHNIIGWKNERNARKPA